MIVSAGTNSSVSDTVFCARSVKPNSSAAPFGTSATALPARAQFSAICIRVLTYFGESLRFCSLNALINAGTLRSISDSGSIVLETVKPAEDGRGAILRLYESMGQTARGTLRLPGEKRVFLSSMDETEETYLCTGKEAPLTLRPFEIATLRVME